MKTSLSESADNALAASSSQEETETVNGIPWEYTVSNGKATVTDVPETVSGSVTVPSTLGGYPVTSIGDYAFSGCDNLKSVVFDGNAPVVGRRVFNHVKQGCTAYVRKDSSGWNVPIPGVWNGINIEFRAAD